MPEEVLADVVIFSPALTKAKVAVGNTAGVGIYYGLQNFVMTSTIAALRSLGQLLRM